MAMQEVRHAMIMMRDEDGDLRAGCGMRYLPLHSETSRDRAKMFLKLTHGDRETCKVSLDARQKKTPLTILILASM